MISSNTERLSVEHARITASQDALGNVCNVAVGWSSAISQFPTYPTASSSPGLTRWSTTLRYRKSTA